MERPDFFILKNGEKAKLPFSNEEYDQRVRKLRDVMDKSYHVFLAGEGAMKFAEDQGYEVESPNYFYELHSK